MSEIDLGALDAAIARGLSAVWASQREDGAIDGVNRGGPLYSGIALAARAQIGALDDADRTRVVPWMKSCQLADGSYPASPRSVTGTLDSTAATYAGLHAAGVPKDDPAQAKALRYIEDKGGFRASNPMYFPTLAIAGLIAPEELPKPYLFVQLVPFLQTLMGRRFNQWIGMSADLNPLITRGLLDGGERAPWLLHPLRRLEEERVLEFLSEVQNPSGSLSGVLIYTAQLVSTFQLMEVPRTDPRFAAAVDALSSFRIETAEGMEYMPCTAEIWNTAEAIRATMRAGGDPKDPKVRAAVDWLIACQTTLDAPESWQNPRELAPRRGGWPFEATNVRNPDCDTTGAALHGLAWVLARDPEDRKVRASLRRGLDWLLPMQNDDGGWPSMTRGVGKKPPGPFFKEPFWPPTTIPEMIEVGVKPPLELQDPATAAMTGRIVRAITDSTPSEGGLSQVHEAAAFIQAQQWNDRWWGRWEVNWIAGTAFGLIGLRDTGVDMRSAWIDRAASFITGSQNADGGFGEGTETYRQWDAKGPWPSRADLTGKAILGLIDARGPDDPSVRRAVAYLIGAQGADGRWTIDDGEYVILPPDLFYTNPLCNQIDALEGLIYYREALSGAPLRAPSFNRDWSDAKLDAMRSKGDPAADAVIAKLFANGDVDAVSALFRTLVRTDQPVPGDLPEEVRAYFEETEGLPDWADQHAIAIGEEAFGVHGMSMICGLFCSALPHAYCAFRGATVLLETGRMTKDFTRRIVETAQFVMDVMAPGGLTGSGRGVRTTQKVRLMHAAVRHLLLHRGGWDSAALGVPLNQEDLAGTLLTFSVVILDALDVMGIGMTAEQKRAYFHSWCCVGHVLGIDESMIPRDIEDAYALYAAIRRRQFAPSPQGKELLHALITATEGYVPGNAFDGAVSVYIRRFLGDTLADGLDVPQPNWTRVVFLAETFVARVLDHGTERSAVLAALTGHFARLLMEGLAATYREGKQVDYDLPDSLAGTDATKGIHESALRSGGPAPFRIPASLAARWGIDPG
ncbi:MAG: oxygenase MpaB family protein [Sandaracinaceae bacterium]